MTFTDKHIYNYRSHIKIKYKHKTYVVYNIQYLNSIFYNFYFYET